MEIIKIDDEGRIKDNNNELCHSYSLIINVMEIQNLIDSGKKEEAHDIIVKHVGDYFKERIIG